jgi:hypothetical protein
MYTLTLFFNSLGSSFFLPDPSRLPPRPTSGFSGFLLFDFISVTSKSLKIEANYDVKQGIPLDAMIQMLQSMLLIKGSWVDPRGRMLEVRTPFRPKVQFSNQNFPQKRHSFIAQKQSFPQKPRKGTGSLHKIKNLPQKKPCFLLQLGKTWNLIPRCQENAY